jgi:hypothetical protein
MKWCVESEAAARVFVRKLVSSQLTSPCAS